MIGNAVPVNFAQRLAQKIADDLEGVQKSLGSLNAGVIKHFSEVD
jgi:hypothetical protein